MAKDTLGTPQRVLITGGAGFIGSHVLRHFVRRYPEYVVFNVDKLGYAGNLKNVADLQDASNYHFIRADLGQWKAVCELFSSHRFDSVIHLAAESHVDRSIMDARPFGRSNVMGTLHLLEAARKYWKPPYRGHRFYHISTDEVYGSLGEEGVFSESSPYAPRSPYAASKAAADHFVRAYGVTYGFPVVLSACSNNYGPFQFPEKLIPLSILHFSEETPVPVYGQGEHIRDWLYVGDHVSAIDRVFHRGQLGETYHVCGGNEKRNIDVLQAVAGLVAMRMGWKKERALAQLRYVKDRAGHDYRYAMEGARMEKALGWRAKTSFSTGLATTVDWYLGHKEWVTQVRSGAYRRYYRRQYGSEDA